MTLSRKGDIKAIPEYHVFNHQVELTPERTD